MATFAMEPEKNRCKPLRINKILQPLRLNVSLPFVAVVQQYRLLPPMIRLLDPTKVAADRAMATSGALEVTRLSHGAVRKMVVTIPQSRISSDICSNRSVPQRSSEVKCDMRKSSVAGDGVYACSSSREKPSTKQC